jgi:hypothetical protein
MLMSVIIVNYNTASCVGACIESVLKQQGIAVEIIVVDNASTDYSLEILQKFGDHIRLISNAENVGFAKANNIAFQAIQQERSDYIFLLNPDAVLSSPNDLSLLWEWMQKRPLCGLASPRVLKGTQESLPNKTYPGEAIAGYPFKQLPGEIAWVLGAAMTIPSAVYKAVRGFDEDFFLYGEDMDLCLRIRQLGYEIGYIPEVAVLHEGAVSERDVSWYERTLKKQKAMLLFYQKHYDRAVILDILRSDISRARKQWRLSRLRFILSFGLWKRDKDQKYRAILDFSNRSRKP